MPTYSYECPVHGEFDLTVPVSRHADHPPCPVRSRRHPARRCDAETVQTYHASRPKDWGLLPVVIHIDKRGNVRFPGQSTSKVPRGFERVELRTLPEIQAFEKEMNVKFSREAEQHHANEEKFFAPLRAKLRSDLRAAMARMSPLGRDFARAAMAANDARPRKSTDTGFHLQILHYNATNREPFRPDKSYKPVRWI